MIAVFNEAGSDGAAALVSAAFGGAETVALAADCVVGVFGVAALEAGALIVDGFTGAVFGGATLVEAAFTGVAFEAAAFVDAGFGASTFLAAVVLDAAVALAGTVFEAAAVLEA